MKAVIILPTYNEKKNISIIVPRLFDVFKSLDHDMRILVVDDNSPDGTADEVKKLQSRFKNLHLLQGEKKGLGVAYLRGFDHAIHTLDADVVFMMDADLSHPAEMIPQFMEEIGKGHDLVIGSRYVKGGDNPDWDLKRKTISKGGNFFARIVAGLYRVHDCTSGFRAIRTGYIKKIDREHLHTKGYAFLSTLLFELITNGAKVKEIPLVFRDRKYGQTKLSTKDMVEFFFNAFRLRFKSSRRMIKFGIVGGSGIFVNLGIFQLMKSVLYPAFGESNATLLASSITGDELSIIWNFLLNHFWTFKKSTNKDHVMLKLLKFHLVAVTSVLINNAVLFALHRGFGVWDLLAKFIGILVAFVWNYLVNVKWTWREKI